MKFNDYLQEKLKNPKFKKHFEEYDLPVRLAAAIVEAREKAGLTQAQLADRIGTKQPAIARLEAGDDLNPRLQTIEKIVAALPDFKLLIKGKWEAMAA